MVESLKDSAFYMTKDCLSGDFALPPFNYLVIRLGYARFSKESDNGSKNLSPH